MVSAEKQAEIAAFIEEMTDNEQVRLLLTYCVGRLMLRNARRGKPLQEGIGTLLDVIHVTDWLASAVINEAPWLANTDGEGRPKKLMKFSSFEQIMREADKAMLIEARKSGDIKLNAGDEELVTALADGYYVVRLLTPSALDRESGEMQHCIGAGSYDNALANRSAEFFSLRDVSGNAHATMEVNSESLGIIQLQGKQNRLPEERYIRLLLPMMKEMRLDLGRLYLGKTRFIDDGYNFVDLRNLAAGTVINRHVYLENETDIGFPDQLEIRGSLNLINCDNVRMPETLSVSGDLTVERTDGVSRCGTLRVDGSLRVSESSWEEVADELNAGSVFITSSSVLKLADRLEVRRDLSLKDCAVRDLGTLELLDGGLSLSEVPRLEFKRPIRVSGRLHLPQYEGESLPTAIHGYSSLAIPGSLITSLPEGLALRELDISYTPIEKLPERLEVTGRLTAWGCVFPDIPTSAKISGDLDISRSRCRSLPEDLTLSGKLDVSHCEELMSLPDGLTVKWLRAGSSKVRHIGSGLVVQDEANFNRSDIEVIPSDAEFHGDVHARQCDHLREVGRAFFGGKLNLQGSGPIVMADGLDIVGDLVLGEIDRLPRGLCVGGDLYTEGDVAGIETAVLGGTHKMARLSIAVTAGPNTSPGHG
ncbi:PcfJ domain-containing protein [Pararhizobium sp. BT-229]|uniref:PcfJ domain-containing protein n=1 Tax=Pararhizobium sp. BT-229 TaxID=2986923 RepID=UPI0021F6A4F2|nr:PcfJ domain-containing protein [Pararhizobium sp. BT-229]MCV9963665.1 PcfJ domain-containing protein [Pararhizobium sp. BT-229]